MAFKRTSTPSRKMLPRGPIGSHSTVIKPNAEATKLLFEAIARQSLPRVKEAILRGPHIDATPHGKSPLSLNSSLDPLSSETTCQIAIHKTLLDEGADPELPDDTGDTPGHHSAFGLKVCLFNITTKESSPLAIEAWNHQGFSPIHLCLIALMARRSHERTLRASQILTTARLRGIPLDTPDQRGNTLAHYAVALGIKCMIRSLISHGISLRTKNKDGLDPKKSAETLIPKIKEVDLWAQFHGYSGSIAHQDRIWSIYAQHFFFHTSS